MKAHHAQGLAIIGGTLIGACVLVRAVEGSELVVGLVALVVFGAWLALTMAIAKSMDRRDRIRERVEREVREFREEQEAEARAAARAAERERAEAEALAKRQAQLNRPGPLHQDGTRHIHTFGGKPKE